MEEYVFWFLLIFAAALLLAALSLFLAKDPRNSIFLARSPGIKKEPLPKAREQARKVAAAVAAAGTAIAAYSIIALIRMKLL